MSVELPRVFTISAGADFLGALAKHVLDGFPAPEAEFQLSDWTILLPTRRAARQFAQSLLSASGKPAMVLPRIRPIGDIDEDGLSHLSAHKPIGPAMANSAILMELVRLVKAWAQDNLTVPFAEGVAHSPYQAMQLAQSLSQFLVTTDTQEADLASLNLLYQSELSEHREAILGLLALVGQALPALQRLEGLRSAATRRNLLIRQEALRITAAHHGPIIAAGSTGTIPATRALLLAIAQHKHGAVVLPGLDLIADQETWDCLPEEHPQFSMKRLLIGFDVKRSEIKSLDLTKPKRGILSSEMMRPSATVAHWHINLPKLKDALQAELTGLHEIAARDRHQEARMIAILMRQTLETPGKTCCLITPDRDLAARVIAELSRWNVVIEDSAGKPLLQSIGGSLMMLVLRHWQNGFGATDLLALLRHDWVCLGYDRGRCLALIELFEIVLLRSGVPMSGTFGEMFNAARILHKDSHSHPLIKRLTQDDWIALEEFTIKLDNLQNADLEASHSLSTHLQNLKTFIETLTSHRFWEEPSAQMVLGVIDELNSQTGRWDLISSNEALLLLREVLAAKTFAAQTSGHKRLAILGTLEARLLSFDVTILGGLNEGKWPAQPDPGPWLNRTMRKALDIPQPEKDIGLAAHDFEQGLGCPEVYLTWSKRIDNAPAGASRWLLRLKAVCDAAGLCRDTSEQKRLTSIADMLLTPTIGILPVTKPNFAPPLQARPTTFSVTEVEKLIRNPYAIYAKKVLKLIPLETLEAEADASLRGSLFHKAIGDWNLSCATDHASLIALGKSHFANLLSNDEVRHFWWPHFVRVADYLVTLEPQFKPGLFRIAAEVDGALCFEIDGTEHKLKARADRIDLLHAGMARLIDYKTGQPPGKKEVETGLSPQMILEAAILMLGGFSGLGERQITEALYVRIGAGKDALKCENVLGAKSIGIEALAPKHLHNFKDLLAKYRTQGAAYLPRVLPQKEDDPQDYDHLSRYLEWQMAGRNEEAH